MPAEVIPTEPEVRGPPGRGGGRERKSRIKLTFSGTQENFSEIIKGTPSIAAKEEKKEKMAL